MLSGAADLKLIMFELIWFCNYGFYFYLVVLCVAGIAGFSGVDSSICKVHGEGKLCASTAALCSGRKDTPLFFFATKKLRSICSCRSLLTFPKYTFGPA